MVPGGVPHVKTDVATVCTVSGTFGLVATGVIRYLVTLLASGAFSCFVGIFFFLGATFLADKVFDCLVEVATGEAIVEEQGMKCHHPQQGHVQHVSFSNQVMPWHVSCNVSWHFQFVSHNLPSSFENQDEQYLGYPV